MREPSTIRDTQRTGTRWLGRLRWFAAGILATLLALAAASWLLAPQLLAHRGEWPFERALGRWAIDRIASERSRAIATPTGQSRRAIETGRIVYLGACAQCHGADADGKGWLGTLSYPPASPLDDADTRARSDAELYWIIANGLSFAGMPGFRDRLSEEQIWSVVAYIRGLQSGNAAPLSGVPTPSTEGLGRANPATTGAARGAALYVSLGCVNCHGAGGNAAGRLQLRATDQRAVRAIREGTDEGMPAYSTDILSESDLEALLEYIRTFSTGS
ncbi:MAG: c-type cytochrome [Thermomicrobium sp.]|nr:c-type cytochrome [Thermomicrobium sp.]